MKLNLFKVLLNKINKFALQRNASKLEERGIITNKEAMAIYQGKIKSTKDLYRFRKQDLDFKELNISKKR